ncbi:MAG: hypothetical protein Q9219_004969 [cf. Caloplaca sp. 3 TL-2023]
MDRRTLEANIGIFCGCLPTMNPLLRYLRGKTIMSTSFLRSLLALERFSANDRTNDSGTNENATHHIPLGSEKRTYRELIEDGKAARVGHPVTFLRSPESVVEMNGVPVDDQGVFDGSLMIDGKGHDMEMGHPVRKG